MPATGVQSEDEVFPMPKSYRCCCCAITPLIYAQHRGDESGMTNGLLRSERETFCLLEHSKLPASKNLPAQVYLLIGQGTLVVCEIYLQICVSVVHCKEQ